MKHKKFLVLKKIKTPRIATKCIFGQKSVFEKNLDIWQI